MSFDDLRHSKAAGDSETDCAGGDLLLHVLEVDHEAIGWTRSGATG
jgi:hypothetical protein